MNKRSLRVVLLAVIALLSGCVSPPSLQTAERKFRAKEFAPPPSGWSGLYVYAEGNGKYSYWSGISLAYNRIYVDGRYAGDIIGRTFLWRKAPPGKHHIEARPCYTPQGTGRLVRQRSRFA